ncbi:MAG: YdhR family protein [Rubrobacteraceae bacterium]
MHILIVNFNLKDMGDGESREISEQIAPAFAELPGLISKTWLANPETNTYGGVYIWRDREAMENYKQTDIYKGVEANPHFENLSVKDFGVMEEPTRITRGLAGVAA